MDSPNGSGGLGTFTEKLPYSDGIQGLMNAHHCAPPAGFKAAGLLKSSRRSAAIAAVTAFARNFLSTLLIST
jgi:hypothetical protein